MKNIFILFGATGDLSREKILPALFSVYKDGSIKDLSIIAVSRRDYTDEDFREFVRKEAKISKLNKKDFEKFLETITYTSGTFDDKKLYTKLVEQIPTKSLVTTYLAIAPQHFKDVLKKGAQSNLWEKGSHKILLEKPYAEDLTAFKALLKTIKTYTKNNVLFVDHYLGKAPLYNFVGLRKKNKKLEQYIKNNLEKVVVRLFEKNDVDRRGDFYNKTGAFVDVGGNHILQILGQTLAPIEKGKVNVSKLFASLYLDKLCSVPWQYEGYHKTPGVAKDSKTETAFEIFLHSKLPHLKKIPLLLAGGKGFNKFKSGVDLYFKDGTCIRIGLKPKEEFAGSYGLKRKFAKTKDAYEYLIESVFSKHYTMFVTQKEIEEEWRIIKEVKDCWKGSHIKTYKRGMQVPEYDTNHAIWDLL